MWYANWNNKKYKLIDNVEINKSSREVTYSDFILDFSDCTIEDLPYAQQEVKITDGNDNLKFTGFVSDYKLPELKDRATSVKRLTLSLFSPRQMTTKRTVTIMRTAMLSDIISQTVAPLYQDGFGLETINIEDKSVTVNLISKTIEEVLNYLSNKYSLYWNINEFKKITICSIERMLNEEAKKTININNYKEQINGLISLSPCVENVDYANIINVKNARIFYAKYNEPINVTLSNGDRLDFENPLDISIATAERIAGNLEENQTTAITSLEIMYNNGSSAYIMQRFQYKWLYSSRNKYKRHWNR